MVTQVLLLHSALSVLSAKYIIKKRKRLNVYLRLYLFFDLNLPLPSLPPLRRPPLDRSASLNTRASSVLAPFFFFFARASSSDRPSPGANSVWNPAISVAPIRTLVFTSRRSFGASSSSFLFLFFLLSFKLRLSSRSSRVVVIGPVPSFASCSRAFCLAFFAPFTTLISEGTRIRLIAFASTFSPFSSASSRIARSFIFISRSSSCFISNRRRFLRERRCGFFSRSAFSASRITPRRFLRLSFALSPDTSASIFFTCSFAASRTICFSFAD
mmetsp:Transcript_5687/g.8844  ORF Transcript_5687/g.8844 Transcript_5687/m.8844 type:complete len:271 (-) Transcript_5687:517-1329(-)